MQIYEKVDWDAAIAKVNQFVSCFCSESRCVVHLSKLSCIQDRGFKVAIAFAFPSHVMAFVSQDNLFNVKSFFLLVRKGH